MKKIIISITILVLCMITGYVLYTKINSGEETILNQSVIDKFYNQRGVNICIYEGKKVIFSDDRPTDGSAVMYDMAGNFIAGISSGFGFPVSRSGDNDIEFSKVHSCKFIAIEQKLVKVNECTYYTHPKGTDRFWTRRVEDKLRYYGYLGVGKEKIEDKDLSKYDCEPKEIDERNLVEYK